MQALSWINLMKFKEFVFRRHACEQLEQRAMLTTFVVDTLSDIVDAQDNRTSLRRGSALSK